MKKCFVKAVLLAIVAVFCLGTVAQAKDKKKKKKKRICMENAGKMTGIKDFDTYLLTCDTLWNRITTYRDSIHFLRSIQFWFMIRRIILLIMISRFVMKKVPKEVGYSLCSKELI